MLNDSLKTLAATPPPPAHRPWRFKSARSAHAEIIRLETQLGLPQSPLGYNLRAANSRFAELEAMVVQAAAPKIIPTAIAAPPAPPASEAITFAQWRAMSADNQKSFCMNGGKMLREAFLSMPNRAQELFLSCGGKLEVTVAPVVPKTKNPPANSMWREEFLQLSPKEQTAFFAKGGKLHD